MLYLQSSDCREAKKAVELPALMNGRESPNAVIRRLHRTCVGMCGSGDDLR